MRPVFVEKPLASTSSEAAELEEAARRRGLPLQVGHIERFNPAYEALRRRLFRPRYIRAERSGPFTGRSLDIGAVLDLMIHDIDLVLDQARGAEVVRVEAMGNSILGGHEDLAQARLVMGDGLVADLTACRCQPTAVRQMNMWGAEGFATLDFASKTLRFVEASEEILQKRIKAPEMAPAAVAELKETIFQNVFSNIDHKTGAVTYRKDIYNQKTNEWFSSCPGPEGGHDWQATSYYQPDDLLIIPLSQSCVMIQGHDVEQKLGGGGTAASQKFFFMPGTHQNMGKLAAYRTSDM